MACQDCLLNCPQVYSDKCIQYTGTGNTELSICTGDSLFEVEEALINYTSGLIDDGGILTLSAVTLCTYVSNILGSLPFTLTNVINSLSTGECNLDGRVSSLEAIVYTPFSFDTQCLTGTLTSVNSIIQALIYQGCATATTANNIASDYVKASELCTLVEECLNGATANYSDRMVPYAPIPYIGSLSNFDNTGAGIASAGFANVYLMNGLNGTQDWRGRSPIGAVNNVPGGTLDSTVDPSLPANTGTNYNIGQKAGQSFNTLTIPQIPAHTHGIVDGGHTHNITLNFHQPTGGGGAGAYTPDTTGVQGIRTSNNAATNSVTGITIQPTGGGLPIINIQPSVACLYIIYIP